MPRAHWNNISEMERRESSLLANSGERTSATMRWGALIADQTLTFYQTDDRLDTEDPSKKMMSSYLQAKTQGLFVEVSGLPVRHTQCGYDLYVYHDADRPQNAGRQRLVTYTVGGQTLKALSDPKVRFDQGRSFLQSSATEAGNMVVFRDLKSASFRLEMEAEPEDFSELEPQEEACNATLDPCHCAGSCQAKEAGRCVVVSRREEAEQGGTDGCYGFQPLHETLAAQGEEGKAACFTTAKGCQTNYGLRRLDLRRAKRPVLSGLQIVARALDASCS